MPSRNLLIICIAMMVSFVCYAEAERSRYTKTVSEAMALIDTNFLEPVEARTLFEGAMDGMVGSLGDPYSTYISPQDFTEFQETLDQEFGGVGIVVEVHPETRLLTVMSPLVNTPAYEAGIQAGDVILMIDGQSTQDLAMNDAVQLMRGKPGDPVRLTIRRSGEATPREVVVRRAIIPIESVLGDTRRPDGTWNYFLEDNPRIGYIRVTTFGDHTVEELEKALAQYREHPIDALILDLRDNAGGYLNAAVSVSNMFVGQGTIVSTRGRDGQVRVSYEASPAEMIFPQETPLVVLVNTYTASASEIVAACLQDHGRAAVVGVRSWGKGTVQNVVELEGGKSALKLTTASYWRPSGKNIHRGKDEGEDKPWGVTPDEGLNVPLDEQTVVKLNRLRRQRDIVLRPGQLPPQFSQPTAANEEWLEPESDDEADSEQASDEEEEAAAKTESSQAAQIRKWSDDPQLRRAIEHLQDQLPKKNLTARRN